MKWLTIPEIKRRSKTAKGALKVSCEHWNQLYTATAKELRDEIDKVRYELYHTHYCGLCQYSTSNEIGCDECVLTNFCADEDAEWRNAKDALESWYDKEGGDWHDWKRACKALRDKLKELQGD